MLKNTVDLTEFYDLVITVMELITVMVFIHLKLSALIFIKYKNFSMYRMWHELQPAKRSSNCWRY